MNAHVTSSLRNALYILSMLGPKTKVQRSAEKNVIMVLQAYFPYSKREKSHTENKFRLQNSKQAYVNFKPTFPFLSYEYQRKLFSKA